MKPSIVSIINKLKDTLGVSDAANDGKALVYDHTLGRMTFMTAGGATKTRSIAFHLHGDLAVETGAVSFIAPMNLTITNIKASVDVAPIGSSVLLDINKNGTSMYTGGTYIMIPNTGTGIGYIQTLPTTKTIALGDVISVDVDQVGSTTAGKNLNLTIICTE